MAMLPEDAGRLECLELPQPHLTVGSAGNQIRGAGCTVDDRDFVTDRNIPQNEQRCDCCTVAKKGFVRVATTWKYLRANRAVKVPEHEEHGHAALGDNSARTHNTLRRVRHGPTAAQRCTANVCERAGCLGQEVQGANCICKSDSEGATAAGDARAACKRGEKQGGRCV